MAKKIILLTMVLALSLMFVACGEQMTPFDRVKDSIIREDKSLLVGENDFYRTEILNYVEKDAKNIRTEQKNNVEHTIIKLLLKDVKKTEGNYKAVLKDKTGKMSQEVPLTKDVLGLTYSAVLSDDVFDFKPCVVDILSEKDKASIELVDVLMDAKVDSNKAIEIAYNELEESMKEYFDNEEYIGQGVVKLIHNNRVSDSPYYFYVSFMRDDDIFVSCLIDPKMGSVVNKKLK